MIQKNAYEYAISLLAKRDYCSFELIKKLKNKGYSLKDIENTVNRLSSDGVLRDNEIIINMIKKRLERHPEGRNRLILFLASKGIPEYVGEKYISSISPERIAGLFCKWFLEKHISFDKKLLYRSIHSRGLDEDEVQLVLSRIGNNESE